MIGASGSRPKPARAGRDKFLHACNAGSGRPLSHEYHATRTSFIKYVESDAARARPPGHGAAIRLAERLTTLVSERRPRTPKGSSRGPTPNVAQSEASLRGPPYRGSHRKQTCCPYQNDRERVASFLFSDV